MITTAGFHYDMPVADYFADCCPAPSFTQSIAKILLKQSPAHARLASPKLNPRWEPTEPTKYDIGNIAHALFLGRGKQLVVIQADDWRKDKTKELREAAMAEGKLGVLEKHYEIGVKMAASALDATMIAGVDFDGYSEVVMTWKDGDLWNRAMIDRLSKDKRVVLDLKTTEASAAPQAIGPKIANEGWDIQAAMHEAGLDVLDPEGAGRRKHYFLCLEDEEPFASTISEMSENVLTYGRKQLAVARDLWARSMASGVWPGYPTEILTPEIPEWSASKILEREVAHFDARQAAEKNSLAPFAHSMGG